VDIERDRPSNRRKYLAGAAVVFVLLLGTFALTKLKPAVTTLERSKLTFDTVSVGEVIRDVRAPGTLVPEHVRIIVATTGGRVEALPLRPGEKVTPGSTIVQLSNTDVELSALQVQQQLTQAYASLAQMRSFQQQERITQQGTVAQMKTQHLDAERTARVLDSLDRRQLSSKNEVAAAHERAQEVSMRYELEQRRAEQMQASAKEQLKLAQDQVDGLKRIQQAQQNRVTSMRITAGESGQLQSLGSPQLELGQWVNSGIELARVATSERLKAVLHVPENLAKDVVVGQHTTVDTHDGVVPGHVLNVDPAARSGTVTIEVSLEGPLPKGARADLSIDGAIQIERLPNVMHVGRPAYGAAESTIRLFRVIPNRGEAERVNVDVGKASVSDIVVLRGLARGDSIIISDMSQMLTDSRVRLK
jgi:Multidrug resistance efflux pump